MAYVTGATGDLLLEDGDAVAAVLTQAAKLLSELGCGEDNPKPSTSAGQHAAGL